MADRNRFPLRVQYTDADGKLKNSEPFYDPKLAPILILGLRAAGATGFSVFHDGAILPGRGVSVSKYPGHTLSTRRWNGGL